MAEAGDAKQKAVAELKAARDEIGAKLAQNANDVSQKDSRIKVSSLYKLWVSMIDCFNYITVTITSKMKMIFLHNGYLNSY